MSNWVNVAPERDFPPGSWHTLEIEGAAIAIFNLGGAFYAIEDVCTHDYNPLSGGAIEGGNIICPRHGAKFCIKTGAALTPPAYENVTVFPTRVDNGMVQVRDHRWD
jgi:3-phenylpropionate/trans-cinnamate dioxygenase ferredoxin subunit